MYNLSDYFCNNTIDETVDETDIEYFAGIFILEKNNKPIYSNWFIFDDVKNNYSADRKIWEQLNKEFLERRFSELGQVIGDINDPTLRLYIDDSALFMNGESYFDIQELLTDQLNIVKETFNDDNIKVHRDRKDNYDMSALKNELDKIIFDTVLEHGEDFFVIDI